jgi:hypothetical protein
LLPRLSAAVLAACAVLSCGAEFDSVGQLEGLRVMAVQKDRPYAKPGQEVNLSLLYHDTGIREAGETEGKPRDISVFWLSGCVNPPGDLYTGCLVMLTTILDKAKVSGSISDLKPEQATALLESVQKQGLGFGINETFSFKVPKDIISSREVPVDPEQLPYGISYVFFAACAGELRFEANGGFPVSCYDSKGKAVTARDFVAGYTAIYSYDQISNHNPEILGLDIDGKKVPTERLCVGAGCGVLLPDPERKCEPAAPKIKRCEDQDTGAGCDTLPLQIKVDPESVETDGSLTARADSNVNEQMWANYHADRGKFKFNVSLVNDVNTGFNAKSTTEYIPPDLVGPAEIWVVVRDNRSGVEWARTQVCVTK